MTDAVWVCRGCGARSLEAQGCRRCDSVELEPLRGSGWSILSSIGAAGFHGPVAPTHPQIDLGARRRLLHRMGSKAVLGLSRGCLSSATVDSMLKRLNAMPKDHLEWMNEMESILKDIFIALDRGEK